jgi:hypothetical protein
MIYEEINTKNQPQRFSGRKAMQRETLFPGVLQTPGKRVCGAGGINRIEPVGASNKPA